MMVKIDMFNIHWWCSFLFQGGNCQLGGKNRSCSWSIQGLGKVCSNFMSGGKVKTFERSHAFEWAWMNFAKMTVVEEVFYFHDMNLLLWLNLMAIQPIASLISLRFLKTKNGPPLFGHWSLVIQIFSGLMFFAGQILYSHQRLASGMRQRWQGRGYHLEYHNIRHFCCVFECPFLKWTVFIHGVKEVNSSM